MGAFPHPLFPTGSPPFPSCCSGAPGLCCSSAPLLGFWGGWALLPTQRRWGPPLELRFPPQISLKTTTGDSRFQNEATSQMSHLDFCYCVVAVGLPLAGKFGYWDPPSWAASLLGVGMFFWGVKAKFRSEFTLFSIFDIPTPPPLSPILCWEHPGVHLECPWGKPAFLHHYPPNIHLRRSSGRPG